MTAAANVVRDRQWRRWRRRAPNVCGSLVSPLARVDTGFRRAIRRPVSVREFVGTDLTKARMAVPQRA
jgi:hypothetical protein